MRATVPRFSAFETRMTGFSPEEVVGKNPRILKSGKQDVGFYRFRVKFILCGTQPVNFRNRPVPGSRLQATGGPMQTVCRLASRRTTTPGCDDRENSLRSIARIETVMARLSARPAEHAGGPR